MLMSRIIMMAAVSLASSGCYLRPATSNGPMQTPDGVRVALVGEACADHTGFEGEPVSRELTVKVKIENASARPLGISPRGIELKTDEVEPIAPLDPPARVVLAPGESRVEQLHYLHRALCNQEFQLAFARAFLLDDRPLEVASLRFTPQAGSSSGVTY
jgi:hypothetical protein